MGLKQMKLEKNCQKLTEKKLMVIKRDVIKIFIRNKMSDNIIASWKW